MNVRYRVELSQTERAELMALLSGGKQAVRKLKRAQILLAADAGASDEEIATSVGVGGSTVYRTKRRFVLGNLEAALSEEPRPGAGRKLSGKEEALLVATACSSPPAGRARWTLELLAGEMVKLTEHDSVSRETVRRRLAENDLKPWRKDMWCIPQVDAEYVARMEDVLDLYAEGPIRSARSSASTRARPNSSARCASRSRPSRARSSATTASTSATAPPTCSSSSMSIGPGARSRSPKAAQRWTSPPACANSPTFIFPRPSASASFSTICRPIRPGRSTDLPRLRSATDTAPAGVPLRPQTRQLAEHGRDRDRRAAQPMPGPAHRHRTSASSSETAAWERQRNASRARIKWMFTTAKARAKMGRAYPEPAAVRELKTKKS